MSITNLAGLGFILLFFLLMLSFFFLGRKKRPAPLRPIDAFQRLREAIGIAVEDGTRLHVSVGRGTVDGVESASAFAGLHVLARIMRIVSICDRHPVASTGDGALSILARDTLKSAYADMGQRAQYHASAGRLTGITPFSFAAGSMPLIADEDVSANVLIGHFGPEVALMVEAGERKGNLTLAGTDSLPGQAVLYAAAQEPLIGEEVFAGGAYLQSGGFSRASLQAQDVMRWLIIVLILGGAILQFLGLMPVFG
ncbi:MAG: hypothetical protein D6755_01640 [Anaerolineae bacterium]|nr:MAG: hypothetical protein D6755_01640 [Anaerolineae bacterium]